MLLGLLLTLNIMICLALIGVVLLQRSEGGALGSGSPTGLITTRGAGDLLTRTTWILFSLFLTISLALTLIGGRERSSQAILERLKTQSINPDTLPAPSAAPAPAPAPGAAPSAAAPPPLFAGVKPAPAARPPTSFSAPVPHVRLPSQRGSQTAPASEAAPALPPVTLPSAAAPIAPPASAPPPAAPQGGGNTAPQ